MSETTDRPVLVHRKVGSVTETCDYGQDHEVTYVQSKRLFDTGRREYVHNGYSKVEERVMVDHQGREYVSRSPIDFSGGTTYVRRADRVWFGRLPSGRVRDLAGRPLDPRTPPGPAWTVPEPDPAGVPL